METTPLRKHLNTIVLIAASILSSVLLILANKLVMRAYQFDFVLTLSALHFAATALFSKFAAKLSYFEPKRDAMPRKVVLMMAVFGTGSIVFMNMNLKFNSIGFYQMTKLLCIPYMVTFQRLFLNKKMTFEVLLSLLLILTGVGIVTITDVQVNATGFIFGVLAVISTAQFQIWQGTKQAEYNLNPMQITDVVMPIQFVFCAILAIILETDIVSPTAAANTRSLFDADMSLELLQAILVTCCLAIAVNLVTYALIGKTSAITYQVVGHFKTVLTLIGGFYLFPADVPWSKLATNVTGIIIALAGMVFYGDAKVATPGTSLLNRFIGFRSEI